MEALIISQDPTVSSDIRAALEDEGWRTIGSNAVGPARKFLSRGGLDLLVLDENALLDANDELGSVIRGLETPPAVFAALSSARPPLTPNLSPDAYLDLPIEMLQMRQALSSLNGKNNGEVTRILGRSSGIQEVRETVEQIAPTPVSVLITGESGTGKTLVAEVLHERSPRASKPFLTLNCGSIPESLLESELFGHERGAFTDARSQRRGLFESANGGTVFLDEIGEMSLSAQVRLLHVLERKSFTRLGSSEPIQTDIRVIAATNKDLVRAVTEGGFRRDLYYRLKVVEIHVPSLRSRPEDLPALVDRFIEDIRKEHGVPPIEITPDGVDVLRRYPWPGNIRELRNLVERLMVLSVNRQVGAAEVTTYLHEDDHQPPEPNPALPIHLGKTPEESSRDLLHWAVLEVARDVKELKAYLMGREPAELKPLPVYHPGTPPLAQGRDAEFSEADDDRSPSDGSVKPMQEVERDAILNALRATNGHRKQAAKLLKMAERTLYRKIRHYGL